MQVVKTRTCVERLLFTCALMACFASPCRAEVQEKMNVNYYAVTVGTQALGDALLAANPMKAEGGHAYTAWHINWHFETSQASGSLCKVSSVTTTLAITMTLPQLASAPPDAQAKFDAYLPKLRLHEDGHAAIARQTASQIDSAIAGAANIPCGSIVADVNKIADDIINAAKATEVDYDATTHHGKTQGAWLE